MRYRVTYGIEGALRKSYAAEVDARDEGQAKAAVRCMCRHRGQVADIQHVHEQGNPMLRVFFTSQGDMVSARQEGGDMELSWKIMPEDRDG